MNPTHPRQFRQHILGLAADANADADACLDICRARILWLSCRDLILETAVAMQQASSMTWSVMMGSSVSAAEYRGYGFNESVVIRPVGW